jgi:hypothetical protein
VPSVEVPVDPGGEERALEEAPTSGDEETGTIEAEPEVDLEAPPAGEVTSAATEAPDEIASSMPTTGRQSVDCRAEAEAQAAGWDACSHDRAATE